MANSAQQTTARERTASAANEPLIGAVLAERYRLVEKLGEGGMGVVFKAVHTQIDRVFAIKLLSERARNNADSVQRFEREAKVGGMLGGRYIVPVLDYAIGSNGSPFFVMEYVHGEDLSRILQREKSLSPRRAVNLIMDACTGLAIAHAHGIIHRDLKPSNLLVTREEHGAELCRVTDFGVAKVGAAAVEFKGSVSTETGALVGTVAYMAPEQIRGEPLDERADVFALGSILYEALSGNRLHSAASAYELMYKVLEKEPPHVCTLQPTLPMALGDVVHQALASHPDDRFASVLDLSRALLPFSGRDPLALTEQSDDFAALPTMAEAAPEELRRFGSRSSHRRRGKLQYFLAGVAASAVAFGVYAWASSMPQPSEDASLASGARSASASEAAPSPVPPPAAAAPEPVAVSSSTEPAGPRVAAQRAEGAALPAPRKPRLARAPTAGRQKPGNAPAAAPAVPRFETSNPYEANR